MRAKAGDAALRFCANSAPRPLLPHSHCARGRQAASLKAAATASAVGHSGPKCPSRTAMRIPDAGAGAALRAGRTLTPSRRDTEKDMSESSLSTPSSSNHASCARRPRVRGVLQPRGRSERALRRCATRWGPASRVSPQCAFRVGPPARRTRHVGVRHAVEDHEADVHVHALHATRVGVAADGRRRLEKSDTHAARRKRVRCGEAGAAAADHRGGARRRHRARRGWEARKGGSLTL